MQRLVGSELATRFLVAVVAAFPAVATGINCGILKQLKAMERLQRLETLSRPNN